MEEKSFKQMKEDLDRIIYWWRRYEGKRAKFGGKTYDFGDLDLLQKRFNEYYKNPDSFNFAKPDMGVEF